VTGGTLFAAAAAVSAFAGRASELTSFFWLARWGERSMTAAPPPRRRAAGRARGGYSFAVKSTPSSSTA
jgi:hypothetical protein